MDEKLYDAYEVARILKRAISADTIKRYCRQGRIKGVKRRIQRQMTPLTGIERKFPDGMEIWMVPAEEVERLKKEYDIE